MSLAHTKQGDSLRKQLVRLPHCPTACALARTFGTIVLSSHDPECSHACLALGHTIVSNGTFAKGRSAVRSSLTHSLTHGCSGGAMALLCHSSTLRAGLFINSECK